jgi:(E)-4-hydroxy-3-methylbut-2-enyl-diphosphate synthase
MVTKGICRCGRGNRGAPPSCASCAPVTCDAAVLGVPVRAAAVKRRTSRQVALGDVKVGGGTPVSVQSMTTTVTAGAAATLHQVAKLAAAACQIVRVAVPSQDDGDTLPAIVRGMQIPAVADVHVQPLYVLAAIDAGVRVNPGMSLAAGVPIRIGVNAGSPDLRLLARYGRPPRGDAARQHRQGFSLLSKHGFGDIKVSVNHHDPVMTIRAYRMLAARCDCPLHLGLWAAGPPSRGVVKSAVAIGALLAKDSATRCESACPRRRLLRSGSVSSSFRCLA